MIKVISSGISSVAKEVSVLIKAARESLVGDQLLVVIERDAAVHGVASHKHHLKATSTYVYTVRFILTQPWMCYNEEELGKMDLPMFQVLAHQSGLTLRVAMTIDTCFATRKDMLRRG